MLDWVPHICRTKDLLCSCMSHQGNIAVLWGPQVEVGTGQEDMVLCHLGNLHSYLHNSFHTLVQEEVHNPVGSQKRRGVEVVLLEEPEEHLEVQAPEALEDMLHQEEEEVHPLQQAPVLDLNTGLGKVVLHSQEQEEDHFVLVVKPENQVVL